MGCHRCGRDVIVLQRYSGLRLCRDHFRESLEARARRAIRVHGWIRPKDRIAIGLSGGPGSSSLLHFLSVHFGMRPDLGLIAITLDEGTGAGRDMDQIRGIAEGRGIEWAASSFSREFGDSLNGIPAPGRGSIPWPCFTWLRDHALASLAGEVGATKLALGTSLDDAATSIFLTVLRGEGSRLLHPPPGEGGIPRIRPFLGIPEGEIALYARLHVPGHIPGRDPNPPGPLEGEAGRILAEYADRHPSAMFSLLALGEALSGNGNIGGGEPQPCGRCGELCPPSCPAREIHGQVTGHG